MGSRVARAVVHIGTEKTGSTALQHLLAASRAVLHDQGVYVPLTGSVSEGYANHVGFAAAAVRDENIAQNLLGAFRLGDGRSIDEFRRTFASSFEAEVRSLPKTPEALLLSTEHAHSRLTSPEDVRRLRDLIHTVAEQVDVVLVVRPQHEVIRSLVHTVLWVGHPRSVPLLDDSWGRPIFPSDSLAMEPHRRRPGRLDPYLCFGSLAKMWEEVLGHERIRVLRYAPEITTDLFTAFGDILGVALSVPKPPLADKYLNRSLSGAAQRMLLALNIASEGEDRMIRQRARDLLLERLVDLPPDGGILPSRAEVVALQSMYEEENEALRTRYFPELDVLFPNEYSQYPDEPMEFSPDYDPRVAAAIVEALRAEDTA